MINIKYFRALKRTRRFNKNQKVWIRYEYANHLEIWFKFRGKGRYVGGTIDKFCKVVGELKEIEVSDGFAKRTIGPSAEEIHAKWRNYK